MHVPVNIIYVLLTQLLETDIYTHILNSVGSSLLSREVKAAGT